MNTTTAIMLMGEQMGVTPIVTNAPPPATITELVNANGGPGRGGGTRAVAQMLPGDAKIESKMRSVQRYMNAEAHTGKQARGVTEKGYAEAKASLNQAFGTAAARTEEANAAAQAQVAEGKEAFMDRWGGGVNVSVTGDVKISDKLEAGREITSWLDDEDLDKLYDAWVSGDEQAAHEQFAGSFYDNYDVPGGDWTDIDEWEVWGE